MVTYRSFGTVAMLLREEGGDVDQDLGVYGSRKLWIVDARVFAVILQASLMSIGYAVAKRAV